MHGKIIGLSSDHGDKVGSDDPYNEVWMTLQPLRRGFLVRLPEETTSNRTHIVEDWEDVVFQKLPGEGTFLLQRRSFVQPR